MKRTSPLRSFPAGQRGVALAVVLILLLVMTLLGLAAMRGTLMEERMSGNLTDRSLAFQAAEAALREGEAIAAGNPAFPAAGCDGNGLCAKPDPTVAGYIDRWLDPAFAGWHDATVALGPLMTAKPQFFIELMGPAPNWPGCDQVTPQHPSCMTPRYRITARSQSADRAQVVLQSSYNAT